MRRDDDAAERAAEALGSEPPPTPTLPRKGGGGAAATPEPRPWATKRTDGPAPILSARARKQRAEPTDAERKLWLSLRRADFAGTHFRRQVVIGQFIADFACRRLKLVIEVDGGQHCENINDARRTAVLEAVGWRIVRFWNTEVLRNIDGVMAVVAAEVDVARRVLSGTTPTPNPSPQGGGGQVSP